MSEASLADLFPRRRPWLRPVPGDRVRYQQPELPALETVAPYYALSEAARWYSNGGPCAIQLAERLRDYLSSETECLLVGNCTVGLMVALRAACGEPTDARPLVITPSFTFAATAGAITWTGFEPLFVDVDERSWQMAPDSLAAALESHSGAVAGVLGCSTFGTAPPVALKSRWREICDEHGVPLLIDSAAAFGAVDEDGLRVGSQGETEVFSFHATKPFAIGEGGLVVTRDQELFERMSRLINFGFDPVSRLAATSGFNAKLSEIHAAFGLAMLERFDGSLARRRATAARLRIRLMSSSLTYQQGVEKSTQQVFQTLMPTPGARAAAVESADALNVEVRTCFDPPLHRHPAFAGFGTQGPLPVTELLASRALSLPMANELPDAHVDRLVNLVESALAVPLIAC